MFKKIQYQFTKWFISLSAISLPLIPSKALASHCPPGLNHASSGLCETQTAPQGGGIFGGNNSLVNIVSTLIQWAIGLAGIVAVIFIIYGGYEYITGGEDGKTKGKARIWNAIIGLVIILLAWIIVRFVGRLINTGSLA